MKVTKCYCDLCGNEAKERELIPVEITIKFPMLDNMTYQRKDVCEKCILLTDIEIPKWYTDKEKAHESLGVCFSSIMKKIFGFNKTKE